MGVFISYSRADYIDDNGIIRKGSEIDIILNELDRMEIDYWIDINNDYDNKGYLKRISDALSKSDTVLFISSKKSNSQESYWPIKEVSLAAELHIPVIPIKIDNTEFNDSIKLVFAGEEIIEFYKNHQSSLKKMSAILGYDTDDDEDSDTHSNKKKKISVWGMNILRILLIVLGAFLIFFSVGVSVGYFSKHEKTETLLTNAIKERRISVIDSCTVMYYGEITKFEFNLSTGTIVFHENSETLLQKMTFENIVMSISFPTLFSSLFKKAKMSGNGKTTFFYIVGGTVGIICGYAAGKYVGELIAITSNEKNISEELNKSDTREQLKNQIKIITQ